MTSILDPRQHVAAEMEDWLERGLRIGCLSSDELAIMRDASALIPAFEGEQPLPCHRDYCPANWLVSDEGGWTGVIDFEFSGWDVRTADFSRYPNWEWISRPDLVEAFFTGYGRSLTPREEQQRLFSLALYALGAIVWGKENEYHIFAAEGRRALLCLKKSFGS